MESRDRKMMNAGFGRSLLCHKKLLKLSGCDSCKLDLSVLKGSGKLARQKLVELLATASVRLLGLAREHLIQCCFNILIIIRSEMFLRFLRAFNGDYSFELGGG